MSDEKNVQTQIEPDIQLTLDPETEPVEETKEEPEQEAVKDPIDESRLSEAERKTVDDFAKKIDIMQTGTVLQYGSSAQKKVSDFSDTALKNVRTKDLGETGDLLNNLIKELKNFDADAGEKKGFFSKLFDKAGNTVEKYKEQYDKASASVNKVSDMLEDHQIRLMKDIALLDEMYKKNQQNTKELTMYILAGRKKMKQVRGEELPALVAKAKETGLPEDAQAANDLEQACTRFEKKLYDLELTRQVSLQMAPQIRLVQNNDTLMVEKIESTLNNTIPLWKNQIVLAMGLSHSKEAVDAEREVNNTTNELLKKNAEMLHQSTIDVAKESERGIVDIETLKHTNEQLIATLDEVLKIQKDGREKRQQAEEELNQIENQLTDKLLEVNTETDITKK